MTQLGTGGKRLGLIAWVFVADGIAKAILGVAGLSLIRFMPEREYSHYTIGLGLVSLAVQSISGGMNKVYIVGASSLHLRHPLMPLLGIQVICTTGTLLICSPAIHWIGTLYLEVVILAISVTVAESIRTEFQRELQFRKFSVMEVLRVLVFAACVLIAIKIGQGTITASQVLAFISFGYLVGIGVGFPWKAELRRLGYFRLSRKVLRWVFKSKYRLLFLYCVLLSLFAQIDIFVLRVTRGDSEVATFGASSRLYLLLALALSAVHTVTLPILQKARSVDEARSVLRHHFHLVCGFLPAVLLIAWTSKWTVPLITGGKYPDSYRIFQLLCISATISFAFSPHVNLLLRLGDFRFMFGLLVVLLPLHIVVHWGLSSIYGSQGTAIANVIGYGIINTSVFIRSRILMKSPFVTERAFGVSAISQS